MELLPNNYESLHGWCTKDKALKTMEMVNYKTKLIVEIGVFAGKSLLPLALKLKSLNNNGRVIGIDPWTAEASLEGTNSSENDDWWSKLDYEFFYKYTKDLLKENNVDSIVELIRDKGENCAHKFPDNSISILHIDGNHSEETSTKDVIMWHQKIHEDGYIIFDDSQWSTTQKAQQLLIEKGFKEIHVSSEKDDQEWKIFKKN